MFKLNLKIAWRNLLKHKVYTCINVLGLALGLAGFIFVVLYVNHEKSYDTWDPALDNVYQLQEYSDYYSADKKAHWRSEIDLRLSKIASDRPEVKAVTMVKLEDRKSGITVAGKPAFLQSGIRRSDSLFFKVLPYEFKYGSANGAFLKPNSVVLKETLALKYFGEINPLGKTITIAGGSWHGSEDTYTVTGVVKEPVTPSVINFEAIVFEDGHGFDVSGDLGEPSEIYVRTAPIKNLDQFNLSLQNAYLPVKDRYLAKNQSSLAKVKAQGFLPVLRLAQLKEVHQSPLEQASWQQTLRPVILIAVLLLLVSVINFINLATAQATERAKEIGVRKVVGAHRRTLVLQILAETFMQCLMALFIALLLVEVSLPSLNQLFNLQLILFSASLFGKLLLQLVAIITVVGLLAGVYPALFLSAFKPQAVLKGNFAGARSSSAVRKGLVAIQFVVSISFVIGILIVNYQLNYLKQRDNGFTATGLINIRSDLRYKDYYEQLRRIDGVEKVGYSSAVIGDNMANAQTFNYQNEKLQMLGLGVSIDGLQALDARLLSGRLFSASVVQDTINNAIINESAAKMFGKNMIGQTIMANDTVAVNIVGVIKDLQVEGFESAVKPSIYYVQVDNWKKGVSGFHKQTTLVRFNRAKMKQVIEGIDEMFTRMNEYYPASYTFVEDDLATVLIAHERFEKIVALFSFLSLSLSLFGLFALAAFITKQRTKEIAVRKVLGAAHTDIFILLNKSYVRIVLVANITAFPLAYVLAKKWLSSFAYRIELSPLPFAIALIASLAITIITVTLQARKAANANPVKALKYE